MITKTGKRIQFWPSKEDIRRAREAAGLTQTAAGVILLRGLRVWQNWEGGVNKMPIESWTMFLLLTHQVTVEQVRAVFQPGETV